MDVVRLEAIVEGERESSLSDWMMEESNTQSLSEDIENYHGSRTLPGTVEFENASGPSPTSLKSYSDLKKGKIVHPPEARKSVREEPLGYQMAVPRISQSKHSSIAEGSFLPKDLCSNIELGYYPRKPVKRASKSEGSPTGFDTKTFPTGFGALRAKPKRRANVSMGDLNDTFIIHPPAMRNSSLPPIVPSMRQDSRGNISGMDSEVRIIHRLFKGKETSSVPLDLVARLCIVETNCKKSSVPIFALLAPGSAQLHRPTAKICTAAKLKTASRNWDLFISLRSENGYNLRGDSFEPLHFWNDGPSIQTTSGHLQVQVTAREIIGHIVVLDVEIVELLCYE